MVVPSKVMARRCGDRRARCRIQFPKLTSAVMRRDRTGFRQAAAHPGRLSHLRPRGQTQRLRYRAIQLVGQSLARLQGREIRTPWESARRPRWAPNRAELLQEMIEPETRGQGELRGDVPSGGGSRRVRRSRARRRRQARRSESVYSGGELGLQHRDRRARSLLRSATDARSRAMGRAGLPTRR